jgi:hypothetical protein
MIILKILSCLRAYYNYKLGDIQKIYTLFPSDDDSPADPLLRESDAMHLAVIPVLGLPVILFVACSELLEYE